MGHGAFVWGYGFRFGGKIVELRDMGEPDPIVVLKGHDFRAFSV